LTRTSCAFALVMLLSSASGCSPGSIEDAPQARGPAPHKPALDSGIASNPPTTTPDNPPEVLAVEDAGPGIITLSITPSSSTLDIDSLDPQVIEFSAKRNDGRASAIPVRWSVDHPEIGKIDQTTGQFAPAGIAGKVTVTALAGDLTTSTTIDVKVSIKLEGDPEAGMVLSGAGGLGGVGGEGGGSKLTDKALRAALDAKPTDDPDLTWLYPYDGTVWPRGLAAPLLQWHHGAHAPLAVKLNIDVDDAAYRAELYLGAPAALTPMQPIDRLPIPREIWRNALQSGKTMKVALTIAASDGSGGYTAYKPHADLTWTIAPTTLKGVVYYNSYGTKLAENFGGARGGNGRFGGATLAIRGDAFDPTLVAGTTTSDDSGCRVCHVVSADGSRLLVQRQNYASSSAYDLRNQNSESMYPAADDAKFGWAALSPDGAVALGNAGPPGSTTVTASSLQSSQMFKVSDGTALTSHGLSEFVTQAATPSFAPDMSKLAFNFYSGPGTTDIQGTGRSLVVMDVKRADPSTYDFSNPKAIFTATADNQKPAWPFFLPDMSGVVFELELKPGDFGTWKGTRGELWWADLDGHAHALDRANGKGYLPNGAANHDDDTTLQYEPTVAPIVAGGYAWVVFTSRRLYGNVATRDPFESDPRGNDLTPGNSAGPTTKKLWVSAISLPAKAGSDPSHPAFYLPAQELYAGNSRGYWVLDACKADKADCTAGDECCGGYCTIDVEFGTGTCSSVPPPMCSKEYDKCNVSGDCCRTGVALTCIAGRCATISLQ
jgi:hypothetical protein